MATPLLVLGPVLMATITPGPSMLLAMDHGLRFGVRRTCATAFGNVAATVVQAAFSLAALQLVALGSARLMGAVRLAGVLYLGFLGLRMLWSAQRPSRPLMPYASSSTDCQRFRQAFFVTLWNPTAYLFFAALFPRFLEAPSGLSLLLFGMILPTLAITFTCMMIYARFGQSLVRFLGKPRRRQMFDLLMGASFLGLGGWMAAGG